MVYTEYVHTGNLTCNDKFFRSMRLEIAGDWGGQSANISSKLTGIVKNGGNKQLFR